MHLKFSIQERSVGRRRNHDRNSISHTLLWPNWNLTFPYCHDMAQMTLAMSQILNRVRYYSELNFVYSLVCVHPSDLHLFSLTSAHESGLCRNLRTMVHREPFLGQLTRGDHMGHPGLSQDSHASASGFHVADYKMVTTGYQPLRKILHREIPGHLINSLRTQKNQFLVWLDKSVMPSSDEFSKFRLHCRPSQVSLQCWRSPLQPKPCRAWAEAQHRPRSPWEGHVHPAAYGPTAILTNPAGGTYDSFTWSRRLFCVSYGAPRGVDINWSTSVLRWVTLWLLTLNILILHQKLSLGSGEWKNMGEWETQIRLYSFYVSATNGEKELTPKARVCSTRCWNLPSPWLLTFKRTPCGFDSFDFLFIYPTHAYHSTSSRCVMVIEIE